MKFHYDKETDSLYIDFIDGPGVDNVIITDDIVADIDAQGRLVGLDIQHASQQSDLGNFFVDGMNPVLRPTG
jgi:uncharacterized protein YuzE